ncbi:MAG: DUF4493 domain-containing protein [Muribaculaceae bacterium]|nr:DUF4493 domain-containing protein [Muribaculaceae bacterium]
MTPKIKSIYIAASLAGVLMAGMTGCTCVDEPVTAGTVALDVSLPGDDGSRGLIENLPVKVSVSSATAGIVFSSKEDTQFPLQLTLLGGEYTATATVGDSVPASFETRYFKGNETFTVSASAPAQVTVVCKIQNTAVAVEYDPEVDDVLHNYSLTVGHSAGELTLTGRDPRRGYFMMPAGERDLTWTLAGTTDTGAEFVKTGVIRDVQPATLYTVGISFAGTINPAGGLPIEIEVDTRAEEITVDNVINDAPVIGGIGFDLNEVVVLNSGDDFSDLVVGIASTSALASLSVSSDCFVPAGLPAPSIDFVTASADDAALWLKKGIRAAVKEPTSAINFSRFFQTLLPEGTSTITIRAVDTAGMASTATLTVTVNP